MRNIENFHRTFLTAWLLTAAACSPGPASMTSMDEVDEATSGPHGGRLLVDGEFVLELAIVEAGIPPEFRAWATLAGRELEPEEVELEVEVSRLGGVVERVGFAPAGDYLRGDQTVYEPHSFDVSVEAEHAGRTHRYAYESHEGRTVIPAEAARAAGIETAIAGPGTIVVTIMLYGSIAPDPTRVREVGARFEGLIRDVHAEIGDTVTAGQRLATVEADESLQGYAVTAPITGVVTMRHAEPGEQAGTAPLFEIADYSQVWAELSAFPRDRARLSVGQLASIESETGSAARAPVAYLSPAGDRASQSITARVVLDNGQRRWTPGDFVAGQVVVAERQVPLAVPLAALQTFRDFTVVYARFDATYEVRMLELGRRDAERVEVLGGLRAGTEFVTGNSYLIKADIEKSGASHDH
jgi:cobalt-zinc-cadmium efflux system membrane fusion protein